MPDDLTPEFEPTDFDDALDSWIGGASLTRTSVPVYGNGAVVERMHEITRLLSESGVEISAAGDVSLGDEGNDGDLIAEYESLFEQREASKSVWVIEDVSSVIDEIRDAAGEAPEPPEPLEEPYLRPNASEQQKRAHNIAKQAYLKAKPEYDEKMRAFEKAATAWADNFALRLIERAVVEIRFTDGRKAPGISFEKLREVRNRIGERQLLAVKNGIDALMKNEPVIEVPFSQPPSDDDQT